MCLEPVTPWLKVCKTVSSIVPLRSVWYYSIYSEKPDLCVWFRSYIIRRVFYGFAAPVQYWFFEWMVMKIERMVRIFHEGTEAVYLVSVFVVKTDKNIRSHSWLLQMFYRRRNRLQCGSLVKICQPTKPLPTADTIKYFVIFEEIRKWCKWP